MEDPKALRNELDAALADLEEAGSMAEIATVLAEMLDLLKARKGAVVNVTNQVHPAPVTIAQPDTQIDYFTFEYNGKGQIIKSIPHRSPRKGAP